MKKLFQFRDGHSEGGEYHLLITACRLSRLFCTPVLSAIATDGSVRLYGSILDEPWISVAAFSSTRRQRAAWGYRECTETTVSKGLTCMQAGRV
jgi:hypothetical protein